MVGNGEKRWGMARNGGELCGMVGNCVEWWGIIIVRNVGE